MAFQVALTQIGAETVADSLKLWEEVPISNRPATAAAWLGKAITLIMTRRAQSRALARAYFRLIRALRTGRTTPDPRNPEPTSVSLQRLRYEFKSLAGENAETGSDDEDIPIEPMRDVEEDAKRDDEAARLEIRTAVGNLGPIRMAKQLDEIDTEKPAEEVDQERTDLHKQAGARQAAASARIAMNGGRSELANSTRKDKRALGYIRLSRTGTPCGWCAMLISRGPVYKTERSAERSYGDGDLYHDNCNCYAMPVYSTEEYKTSDLYALNREYQELWPQVTRGLSGKSALTAWRRFVRTQRRAQEASAQPQTAQEA